MSEREMTLEEFVKTLHTGHSARTEYEELLSARAKLEALEGMGVDNWSGYDDAMHYLETGEVP